MEIQKSGVVKVIWLQAASTPNMDDSIVFARLRQCASLYNTCLLAPTRVHFPNGISIGLAIFAQLTAKSPYKIYNGPLPFPLKTAILRMGDLEPYIIHFGPTRVHGPKRHFDRFSHFDRVHDCSDWMIARYSYYNNKPHLCTQYCDDDVFKCSFLQ